MDEEVDVVHVFLLEQKPESASLLSLNVCGDEMSPGVQISSRLFKFNTGSLFVLNMSVSSSRRPAEKLLAGLLCRYAANDIKDDSVC